MLHFHRHKVLSSLTAPLGAIPTATATVSMQRPHDADDMSRWLVDICNQLGVDDGGAARPWGSPPTSEARSPSVLDVSHDAAASQLPASVFVPYASTSASSSPGSASSSVESGGESANHLPPHTRKTTSSRVGAAKSMRRVASSACVTSNATTGDLHQLNLQQQLGSSKLAPDPNATDAQSELAAAEARREKNRLRVRRHYYRKLSLMNDLRAQVSELEERIGGMQQLQITSGGSAGQPSEMEMYVQQLDATRRALEQENQQVREILYQQTRQFMLARQQHLQRLLDDAQLLGTPMPVPFIVKKRLVPTDCDAIWQRTKRELNSLVIYNKMPAANLSEDNGDSICGWKTTRAVEDGAFKFVFQKLMRDCPAEHALNAAWAVFSDPRQFARLYSPTVDMWCAVVQVVDADNVVLFQEHKSMDKDEVHMVMKTILLASRVRNPSASDFGITLRGIEHEQLGLEDLSVSERDGYEVWNDINSWYVLTPSLEVSRSSLERGVVSDSKCCMQPAVYPARRALRVQGVGRDPDCGLERVLLDGRGAAHRDAAGGYDRPLQPVQRVSGGRQQRVNGACCPSAAVRSVCGSVSVSEAAIYRQHRSIDGECLFASTRVTMTASTTSTASTTRTRRSCRASYQPERYVFSLCST